MPEVGTATITSVTGPERDVTALVLGRVSSIEFKISAGVIRIVHGSPERTSDFDLTAVTTITYVISGVTNTITVS